MEMRLSRQSPIILQLSYLVFVELPEDEYGSRFESGVEETESD